VNKAVSMKHYLPYLFTLYFILKKREQQPAVLLSGDF